MLTATLVISNAKYGTRRARLRGKAGVRSRSGQLGDCAACAKLVPAAARRLKEPRWGALDGTINRKSTRGPFQEGVLGEFRAKGGLVRSPADDLE